MKTATRAFNKYTKEKCLEALEMNEKGNGYNTIGNDLGLTFNQVELAIKGAKEYNKILETGK